LAINVGLLSQQGGIFQCQHVAPFCESHQYSENVNIVP